MPQKRNRLAIDIGGTNIKYALVSPDYTILQKDLVQTPYDGVESLMYTLAAIGEKWVGEYDGVGVCLPGAVMDDDDGTICRGGSLTYMDGVPMKTRLEELFAMPCAVENDGKAGALGEYIAGTLKNCHCGVFLGIGTAVAGGIIIDGKIQKGIHCFAGEFSYILQSSKGKPLGASCGVAELTTIARRLLGVAPDKKLSSMDVFQLANAGNCAAMNAICMFLRPLAVQMMNLQAVLDPDCFAVGGGISQNQILLPLLEKELNALYSAFPGEPLPPHVNVRLSKHGNDANLIGASSLLVL